MIKHQRTLIALEFVVLISFILLKFIIRPYVLKQAPGGIAEVFVLSYPNFCEAVVGAIVILLLLFTLQRRTWSIRPEPNQAYLLSLGLTGVYTISQEYKIHNLGGENVFDIYDVYFSVAGLIFAAAVFFYLRPRIMNTTE